MPQRLASSDSYKDLPSKSGYLNKKGDILSGWRKRYLVLEGSLLHVYKTHKDSIPRTTIYLLNCIIQKIDKKDPNQFPFIISHANSTKKYYLSSPTEQETSDWIRALYIAASYQSTKPSIASHREERSSEKILQKNDSENMSFNDNNIETNIDEALNLFLKLVDEDDETEQQQSNEETWKIHSQKDGVTAYLRDFNSSIPSVKGQGRLNHPAEHIFHLILDINKKKTYDTSLSSAKRIRMINKNTSIDYLAYKPVWPTVGRDFVNLVHWRELEDKSLVIIAFATETEECPSKEPSLIRGKVFSSGWKIVPSSDNTWSEVTFAAKVDLKLMNLPPPAVKRVTVQQAFMIANLREQMNEMKANGILPSKVIMNLPEEEKENKCKTKIEDKIDLKKETLLNKNIKIVDEKDDNEFGIPLCPEEYKDRLEKAQKALIKEVENESSWTFHSEKNGVKAFTKSDGELQAAKGIGFIDTNPHAIWELIINPSKKILYDGNLSIGKTLKRFDLQTTLDYLEYKAVWPTTARDFLNLTHWRVDSNGRIFIIAQGIEDSICPKKDPKVVRGHVHVAGWLIVPNSDYTGATVTFVVKTDLKGSLPAFVISKVAAEQPYMIASIRQLLKKSINRSKIYNKLTNAPMMTTTSSSTSSVLNKKDEEGEKEDLSSSIYSKKDEIPIDNSAALSPPPSPLLDIMEKRENNNYENGTSLPLIFFCLFIPVLIASLTFVYSIVSAFLLFFLFLRLHLGPSVMSTRRKLMISTWSAPTSGTVYGSMTVDVTKTESYIKRKREECKEKITITHVIIKALGIALYETPSINGHLVLGQYYPANTADIGCLVALDQGKDLANAKISSANEKKIEIIAKELRESADKLRKGKDDDFEKSKGIIRILPTFLLSPMVRLIGFLGSAVGLEIPLLGVRKHPFGTAIVTSVGMLGLDHAYAPFTPFAHVPILVLVGRISEKPIVENGKVVARRCVTITVTLDHRFADGSQASRLASRFNSLIADPNLME